MFISPMLLETAAGPFSHSDFIFEPKVDGHRLIYSQQGSKVRLYTRHNNDCTRHHSKVQQLVKTLPATFAIFDIIQYKGSDLRSLPLIERKSILQSLILPSSSFGIVPHIEGAGEALFSQIESMGMEGMVGKRKDSIYVSRRSRDWQKVINWSYAEVFITGYKKAEFG